MAAVSQRPALPSCSTQTRKTRAWKRAFDDELNTFNWTLQSKTAFWESVEGTLFEEIDQLDRFHDQDSVNPERKYKKLKTL